MGKEGKNTLQGIQAFVPAATGSSGKGATSMELARASSILNPDALMKRSSSSRPEAGSLSDSSRSESLARQSILTAQSLSGSIHSGKDYAREIKTTNVLAGKVSSILGPNMLGSIRAGFNDDEEHGSAIKDGDDEPRQSKRISKGKLRHQSHSPTRRQPSARTRSPRRVKSTEEGPGAISPRRTIKNRKDPRVKTLSTSVADTVGIDLEDDLDAYDLGPAAESGNQDSKPKGRVRKTRQVRGGDDANKRGGRRGRNGLRSGSRGNVHKEQLAQMTNVDQTKVFREEDVVYQESDESSESDNGDHQQEAIDTTSAHSGGAGYVTSALSGAAVASERAAASAAAATGTVFSAAGGTMRNVGGTVCNVLNTVASTAATSTRDAVSTRDRGEHEMFDDFDSSDEDEPKALALLIS